MASDYAVQDSILLSVREDIGINNEDYDAFDSTLVRHINSAFFVLSQLGVGSSIPFTITGASETWSDFLGQFDNEEEIEAVKTYISAKVKTAFDPPTNGSHLEALKSQSAELEWRLNAAEDEAFK